MDRIRIYSQYISAGAREWLAPHLFVKSQVKDSVLLSSFVTCSELRGEQSCCWLSLALYTVAGGDTSWSWAEEVLLSRVLEGRRQKVQGTRGLGSYMLFLSSAHKFDRLYRQFFWSECGTKTASDTPNTRSLLSAIDRQLLGILVIG